jgi:DNA-binding response OmpR family regulator
MSPRNEDTLVLVADDEPSMLALLSAYIRSKGYRVLEASDGDMAWQLAHQHLPHAVVLDVMMPGMSGWEVCKKIRESVSLAHTGVVMLTGIGESLNELTSPLYGADAYIDKPFEFAELEARIRETLERRRAGTLGRPDGGSDEDAEVSKDDNDDEDDSDLVDEDPESSEAAEAGQEDEPVTQRFAKEGKRKKAKAAKRKSAKAASSSDDAGEEPSDDEESAPPAKKAGKKTAAKKKVAKKKVAKKKVAKKKVAKPTKKAAAKPTKKAAAKPAKKAAGKKKKAAGKQAAAKPAKKAGKKQVAAKPAKKAGKKAKKRGKR